MMSHPLNLTLDAYLGGLAQRGAFDNLSGEGAPLDLPADAPSVLEKLMQEAGAKPVPVLLNQQIAKRRERLAEARGLAERRQIMRELADLQTRMAIEVEAYYRFG